MDHEALSFFQRKLIRTDYFARFPRAISVTSHAQKRIALASRMSSIVAQVLQSQPIVKDWAPDKSLLVTRWASA